MDTRHVLGILLAALVASNAAWAILYVAKSSEYNALRNQLLDLNSTVTKLVEQAKSLDEENTKLLLQLKQARESYERLLDLLRQANMSSKAALIDILAGLNKTLTSLYQYTYSHAYYTPMTRLLYRPGQVADKVFEILGAPVYRPDKWREDMETLFNWTQSNIKYSPDHHFAAIRDLKYVEIGNKRYISSFEIDITDNYIQEPLETLLRGSGDCEDMALLLSSFYSIYLHDVGDSWVICLLADQFSHCLTVAYVKPNSTYVVADPSTGFYTVSKSLRNGLSQWLGYIGVRWDDVKRSIVFNNKIFKEGIVEEIISSLEKPGR